MEEKKFAITPKGLRLMVVGLVVMVAGYILMCGPAVKDPAVFNYDMFDFRRIVVAPVVIVCGVIVEIVAIMRTGKKKE
ncbi:MAG: DUF3098 domain-containing protein [Bacteroidales bacterium]|nr:DUF3098 domain-containing protein [Bacteroidales bacterium]MCQ2154854.1 DUF3098 domain-containing protein [Bacteroidales bacterium]